MTDNDNNRTGSAALPPGYRFNEFEIQDVLGGGGFGIVYRAWDRQLERAVAIKEFMPASLAVRKDDMGIALRGERFGNAFRAGLTSFIDEARLLARFHHPGLVQVLRFWLQNDTAYIVTLFYEGETLAAVRQHQPERLDEAGIRHMLPMLFGALKMLHNEGIVHRDISPDNILLQENGLPVLLDLGAARRSIGNVTDETETLLRPGYAPVEQYNDEDESEQGPWTDIYALGATLHTLIVGSPPPVSVVRSIQDNYQPLAERQPEGYSPSLLQAVDRALALKKEDRPQSIDEFAALIELPVGDHAGVLNASKPGTMLVPVEEAPPVAAQGWKRYQTAGLVAAGVVAGIIVGGLLFSGGAPDAPPVADNDNDAEPVAAAPSPAAPDGQQALVYVRIREGEQLSLNGKAQPVVPAANGFAALQLKPGQYAFTLKGRDQSRSQTLTIGNAGTWLINPQ